MKKMTGLAVLAVLLLTTPAFAQMTTQPIAPENMSVSGGQKEMVETGKIAEVDIANGTVTLDNGTQFTLAPSLQYTNFPATGQEVQVTYSEQDGKKVARIIDAKTTGGGQSNPN